MKKNLKRRLPFVYSICAQVVSIFTCPLSAITLRERFVLVFKINKYSGIEGFLSMREAATLYHFATTVPHGGTIVEIGSWKGKSTYCLARGLKKGKVFAIDPFDASGEGGSAEIYQQGQGNQPLLKGFKNHMRKLRVLGKINILKGYSKDFVNQIDQINLLFIDGDHSQEGAEFDFRSYSPAIANGGYLLFHDYDASRKELGPTWVIENFVVPSNEYEFIGLFDSLWVGRKL